MKSFIIIFIFSVFFFSSYFNSYVVFAQETDEIDERIAERQGNWTKKIWSKAYNHTKNQLKNWFKDKIDQITTPLKDKIQEGSGVVRENLVKIKNFFVDLLEGMGIIRE